MAAEPDNQFDAQHFSDEVAALEAEIADKKITLSPEVFEYVKANILKLQEIVNSGRMPTAREMEFFNHMRTWMGMDEEDRQKLPSIERMLESPLYKESQKRNITIEQWEDVLAIAENVGKDIKWIDGFFIFSILPGLICTKGALTLNNYQYPRLPKNLKIAGSFTLIDSSVEKLPDGFGVAGSLMIARCPKVKGFSPGFGTEEDHLQDVQIDHCESFEKLPEGFRAHDLSMRGLHIKKLPENFRLNHRLLIHACALEEIPDNTNGAKFAEYINIRNCPSLVKLPKAIECTTLEVIDCPTLKKLPDSLRVNTLDLRDSNSIEGLPSGIVIGDALILSHEGFLNPKFKEELDRIRIEQKKSGEKLNIPKIQYR